MAVYTSVDDLVKRLDPEVLAGLADDVNSPPELADSGTQAAIQQAISDGANLIESYLGGRVNTTLPAVADALERINATLALYFLYRRRYVDDAANPLAASREAVEEHLAAIARGDAHLGGADGSAQPEPLVFSTTEDAPRPVKTGLKGY
jgi:phage gp36-like protein